MVHQERTATGAFAPPHAEARAEPACERREYRSNHFEGVQLYHRLWNPGALFEQRGSDTVIWKTVTTGNFMGFDAWITNGETGRLSITANHGALSLDIADIGFDDTVLEAGGLERKLTILGLPGERLDRELAFIKTVSLHSNGDNPIWIRVTTEDGYQAWSNPIFLFQ